MGWYYGVSLAYHMSFLEHSSGMTKEPSGAPLEKCFQSHEDHEMPMDQPVCVEEKN